jgi:hypothetical protein
MESFLSGLVQAIAGSALTILAFVGVRFTKLGERLLDHRLNAKIAAVGHANAKEIETIRSDLAHLQDRGRRANELEFEALTKVWNFYVDAWIKTQQAILEYMSFPDLDALSDSDLATFLDSTELSEPQRRQVSSAKDKKEMYSKILRLRTLNIAGASIYDGRQTLRVSGIFIPSSVATRFKEAFDKLSGAHTERYLAFQHGRGDYETSMEVLDTAGTGEIAELQDLVRSTIRRE